MAYALDFAQLKETVSIASVLTWLDVKTKQHNDQLRGCCPICKNKNPKIFVATPSKGLWFCFNGCKGGDVITLVAKVRGVSLKDAAAEMAQHFTSLPGKVTIPQPPQNQQLRKSGGFDPELYAKTLNPMHEALAPLGLAPETIAAFGGGYSSSGLNRGKLALPVHDREGTVLAFIGRAIGDEQPALTCPTNFNLNVLFNAHRVEGGDMVYVVRDVLDVLRAYETGVTNVVAVLTDLTSDALDILSMFMTEKAIPSVDLLAP